MPATQARTAQRKSKPTVRGKGSSAGARQLSAPEHAYRELRRRILDNDLAPGESYSERQLEQAVGLNSATMRGALRRLAEEGLVELHSRHGVRIVPISLDDLREIFEIMIALEPMAARRVALQDVTKADLDRLTATIRQMDTALIKDDLVAWAKADELFHARLIELCGNKRLRSLLTACMDQRHRARMLTLGARPLPVDSNRDHAAVTSRRARRGVRAASRRRQAASTHPGRWRQT